MSCVRDGLTLMWCFIEVYLNKFIFCGHFFGSAGPKGVINDWRRFKLDSVDQTVPQSKRELLRQMSSPREDDKERLNRKVNVYTHRTSRAGKHTFDRFYSKQSIIQPQLHRYDTQL